MKKVFVVILNRVPDWEECDDFHNNLPAISDDNVDGDADSDEIPDHLSSWFDDDEDNDGIPDHMDENEDGDGIPDISDNDYDNDGILDHVDDDDDFIVEGSSYSSFKDGIFLKVLTNQMAKNLNPTTVTTDVCGLMILWDNPSALVMTIEPIITWLLRCAKLHQNSPCMILMEFLMTLKTATPILMEFQII